MRNVFRLVLAVLTAATVVTAAAPAFAQPHGGRPDRQRQDGGGGRMSGEERQRLREDLQRQQAAPRRPEGDRSSDERARRYAEWQRLSPEQRERVRGDMRDANRDFERRR